ncbi:hypothetical protein evm_005623 [Chilo suppressalis]|nr:hypothetical protein evm_005623 [Chilo suppressalis]
MFKNPNYVYGPMDVLVPSSLQFGEFLLKRMIGCKEKTAFINATTEERTTYGEICQEGMNFAVSLVHLGLRKGQTVAICSENRSEYFKVVLGVICAGGIITTMNPAYVEGEIRHVMKITKPKFIVCSPNVYKEHSRTLKSLGHIKRIILLGNEKKTGTLSFTDITIPVNNDNEERVIVNDRLTRNVRYDEFEPVDVKGQIDTALILYSSGTTGLPKGVMLTHLNLIIMCSFASTLAEATTLTITPWFHAMGLVGKLIELAQNRTVLYLPKFEVDLYLKAIEKYKVQIIVVVPPVLVAVFKAPKKYDLSSVQYVYSGAAPLHKDTSDLVNNTFPNARMVLQGYGLTESTLAVSRAKPDVPQKAGSVGSLQPGLTVKVVDIKTRRPLGPKQTGEICIKGPTIMKGYVGIENKEVFDSEGFFHTGDVGYYDEDRDFFIVDRLKELIKYKGYQVAPAELEALLLKHEAVADAGVVGIPDVAAGEVPLAFVVTQPGKRVTEKELQQFVAERVSNPKHLRGGVRFISAIPKNPSGKILRKELRKMAKHAKSKL